jgi:hypothetical protein
MIKCCGSDPGHGHPSPKASLGTGLRTTVRAAAISRLFTGVRSSPPAGRTDPLQAVGCCRGVIRQTPQVEAE